MSQISELEDKINNSPLLSINEEEEGDRYKNEKMRLILDIVKYVMEIIKEGKSKWDFREIGLEIIEAADDCIEGFDKEEGKFLHYYLVALKNKISEEKRDSKIYRFNKEIKNGKIKKDGEEFNIFDILADEEDFTKVIEQEDSVQKTLKDIDNVFCSCQERQQEILRPLLTGMLIEILNNDLSCKFIDRDMILISWV